MKDSKLISILKKTTNISFKHLGLMTESPYFNKKPELVELYNFLSKFHPVYSDEDITYEKAHNFIFPSQKFSKKRIGYLMSDMLKLRENLMVNEKLESKPVQIELYKLSAYNKLDLDKSFNKSLKDASKKINDNTYKNASFYFDKYALYIEEDHFFSKKQKHIHDASMENAIEYLDLFYLTEKFRIACEISSRKRIVTNDYEPEFVEELLDTIAGHSFEKEPAIAIYSTILKGFYRDKEGLIDHLILLLDQYNQLFPNEEVQIMFRQLVNYCVRKLNGGEEQFRAKLFIIYKDMIKNGFVLDEFNHISPWTYMNIITIGISNKKMEWTEQFINDFKSKLHEKFRDNAYNYNLAYFYFNIMEYTKAMQLLNKVVFNDLYYICESKALLLRLYYVSNEVEAFYSLVDSFRIYIQRNKLMADKNKELYLNLIRFLNKLSKIVDRDKESFIKLKEKIKETKRVNNAAWLIDQIDAKLSK